MLLNDGELHRLYVGDCIPHMLAEMPAQSIDMSVFSPPFPALYAYTSNACDIGNSEELGSEAKLHLSWFYRGLARVLKPGRVACVHVKQIPRLKRTGLVGLFDFRGLNLRIAQRAGLIYEYDWLIRKNPQAQAIRTKSRELQFAGFESDRARVRGVLGDYIIKLRAPGENRIAVDSRGESTRDDWIKWAECCWSDIKETDTLNVSEGRGEDDVKHICPLQLGLIRRLIMLYSNPGEIVFSPFAGIGSEGYEALRLGRRFYGCEIKDEYIRAATVNFTRALRTRVEESRSLFG